MPAPPHTPRPRRAFPDGPAPDPRRGQPAKQQAIIHAARRVFLRHGFTGGSVGAIAAEAGVSKQTVYNHFRDKETLFRAVVRAAHRDAGDQPDVTGLQNALANSDELGRDLRDLGRRWVAMALQDDLAALRRLVIAEWDRHPWLLDEWEQPRPNLERALSWAISRQTERGVLEVIDADLAARQLILVVITETLTRTLYGKRQLSEAETGEIVDNGVQMWLRCYQNTPKPVTSARTSGQAHCGLVSHDATSSWKAGLQVRLLADTVDAVLADERALGLDRPRKAVLTAEEEAALLT